jgi:deoxycytidine triphosphate deaminase
MAFAASDDEAAARYELYRHRDPFPKIGPALLNSTEIIDYVATTGMIYPFRERNDAGEEKLKPASYEVDLLGQITYWDDRGRKIERIIARDESITLPRNSIMFVQVEPYFRLPWYIALRFNLKIQHVYRGLLLGTGPLVDPGFKGPLYIPLHNLTDSSYDFRGGEGLIWMEFTKLNWPPLPDELRAYNPGRIGRFYPFPDRKLQRRTLNHYLAYASPHRPIRSSIPVEITTSVNAAKSASRAVKFVSVVSLVTALGVGATIINLFLQTNRYVSDVRGDVVKRIEMLETRLPLDVVLPSDLLKRIEALERRLEPPALNRVPILGPDAPAKNAPPAPQRRMSPVENGASRSSPPPKVQD